MIISHKNKFIFIKTIKTAGSSLEIALASICGPDDVITPLSPEEEKVKKKLGIRTAQNYNIPVKKWDLHSMKYILKTKSRPSFVAHEYAIRVKKYVGNGIWDSYYKFCFERNPYDKIISWYYHWKGAGKTNAESIDNFIKNGGLRLIVNFDMYSINHQIAVDNIFKFEEINESLGIISSKLKLDQKLKMPTYKAKSNSRLDKRPYQEVIDVNMKKAINLAFAREIKLLNYKF